MKTAIVFYADILGFKEMVSLSNNATNDKTFRKLNEAINAIDATMIQLQEQELGTLPLKDFITYKMFSDSFYLSVSYTRKSPEELNRAIWLTFYIAGLYQDIMLMHQILIRGAVSKGLDHNEKNFIFSPALIKAYTLENTIAVYPRIVIDDDVVSDLKKAKVQTRIFSKENTEYLNTAIIIDWSGVYFLNPFIILKILDEQESPSDIVTILGYGLTMGELVIFFKKEKRRLKSENRRRELDKNIWFESLFYWVGVEDKSLRPKSLIEFEYLSFDYENKAR